MRDQTHFGLSAVAGGLLFLAATCWAPNAVLADEDLLKGELPYAEVKDERPEYLHLLSGKLFRERDNHAETSADGGKTWQRGGQINPFRFRWKLKDTAIQLQSAKYKGRIVIPYFHQVSGVSERRRGELAMARVSHLVVVRAGKEPLLTCLHLETDDTPDARILLIAGFAGANPERRQYDILASQVARAGHLDLRTFLPGKGTGSDEEVARRWWDLFPKRRDPEGRPAEPEPHELRILTCDEDALAERGRRLANLSWFVRCLSEPLAEAGGCMGKPAGSGLNRKRAEEPTAVVGGKPFRESRIRI